AGTRWQAHRARRNHNIHSRRTEGGRGDVGHIRADRGKELGNGACSCSIRTTWNRIDSRNQRPSGTGPRGSPSLLSPLWLMRTVMIDEKSLRFTPTHEWVHMEGDVATVGISRFAVEQLTDLILIELPIVGRRVEAGRSFGEIESVKAVSDLYAPVS